VQSNIIFYNHVICNHSISGEFCGGSVSGDGTIWYPNGDKYVGMILNNSRHGLGVFSSNGIGGGVYSGEWLHDSKHGYGEYQYRNGDVYEGGYRNNKKHGRGELRDSLGNVLFAGAYINGKAKSTASNKAW